MGKKEKKIVEIGFAFANIILIVVFLTLFVERYIAFEVLLALIFAEVIASAFIVYLYLMHKKFKRLASLLGFEFTTRFLEQPRLEGIYRGNWFQLHFTSRDHGEYWGLPRTYIKLQYKDQKEFDKKKLDKYMNHEQGSCFIINVEQIKRSYKNYLLMRVRNYITDKVSLLRLMDLLLKVAKESEIAKKSPKSKN